MPSPEGMRPYEKLPIPTDPDIVHITLLVEVEGAGRSSRRRGPRSITCFWKVGR